MSRPPDCLITRPGGHSAKNAHRVGAPNTQLSGENPMVGTLLTVDESAVTEIRDRLATAGTSWFLDVDRAGRCVRINLWALAALVNDILTEQTAALVVERDAAVWESELREHEILTLIGERDTAEARVTELESALTPAGGAR